LILSFSFFKNNGSSAILKPDTHIRTEKAIIDRYFLDFIRLDLNCQLSAVAAHRWCIEQVQSIAGSVTKQI
jgi:hypothetical protein